MLSRSVDEAGDMHKSVVGGPANKKKGLKEISTTHGRIASMAIKSHGMDAIASAFATLGTERCLSVPNVVLKGNYPTIDVQLHRESEPKSASFDRR